MKSVRVDLGGDRGEVLIVPGRGDLVALHEGSVDTALHHLAVDPVQAQVEKILNINEEIHLHDDVDPVQAAVVVKSINN